MLGYSFSKREKALLLVLAVFLVAGVYMWAVHFPVTARLKELDAKKAEAEREIENASAMAEEYGRMTAELEEIFSMPEGKVTVMPYFDNSAELLFRYQTIFEDLHPDLRPGTVSFDGNIASRGLGFTVTVPDFETASDFLERLTGTGFRCLLKSISLTSGSGDLENGSVTLTGNIIFYELVRDRADDAEK